MAYLTALERVDLAEAMPQVTDGELMMINTLVVRPELRLAYIDALHRVLPQARSLPGCLWLEVGERVDSPGTFVLAERWRNGNEYLNEYLALPFFRDYVEETEQMYAAPRDVVVLTALARR